MYSDAVKRAQRILRAMGGYKGAIDNDPGPKSLEIAERVPGLRVDLGRIMTPERRVIAGAQLLLSAAGTSPGVADGFWGVQTDGAFEQWRANARGEILMDRTGAADFGAQRDMEKRFGVRGNPLCTAGKIEMPWRTVLAWDPTQVIKRFSCHADVAASGQAVLLRVAEIYSPSEIRDLGLDQWGGCFNDRLMRGGTAPSTHAFGAAIDWDPARNRLKWRGPRARLSHPDAVPFWECWEAAGWLSLGRARGFDWMHVQAPAL